MDATTAVVIIVALFALVAVAAFLRFRQRGGTEIKGPFGTHLKVDATNDPSVSTVGIKAKAITSREGGMVADDSTGRGVDVESVDTKDDILLSSRTPSRGNDPKSPPRA